jgi:hypothetical protein
MEVKEFLYCLLVIVRVSVQVGVMSHVCRAQIRTSHFI